MAWLTRICRRSRVSESNSRASFDSKPRTPSFPSSSSRRTPWKALQPLSSKKVRNFSSVSGRSVRMVPSSLARHGDVGSAEEDPLEERLAPFDRRVLPIHFGRAGNRPDPQRPPLEDRDRTAVVADQGRRRVHDRPHDLVEVQRRGDLAAHREKGVQLLDLLLGFVLPRIAQGGDSLPRDVREELLVRRRELRVAPTLVGGDEDAERCVVLDERHGEHGTRLVGRISVSQGVVVRERVLPHDRAVREDVAHEGSADGLRAGSRTS